VSMVVTLYWSETEERERLDGPATFTFKAAETTHRISQRRTALSQRSRERSPWDSPISPRRLRTA
jgi:hypothetical protein